jgi:chaperonin cofactor prefoldin
MDTETITEAPGIDSGADTNAGILSEADLASSFMERVEEQPEEKPSEADAADTTEGEVAEAVEDSEGNVLSQSEQSEEDGEEEAEAEEAEESTEPPKGVGKLLKQVGKLTARAKSAEEQVEAMQAKIAALESQPQSSEPQGSPALSEIADLPSLEKVRQEAIAAKKWAVQHLGKDYVEDGEKEYSGDEIREIFAAADEYLTEKIPQRAQHLQAKRQWDEDAKSTFPFLESQEGEHFELFQQVRHGEQYKNLLDGLPNGDFVAATLVKGIEAVKAESKGKKPAKKRTAKTPPAQVGESLAPPPATKDARQKAAAAKKLGTGRISEASFADFLNS